MQLNYLVNTCMNLNLFEKETVSPYTVGALMYTPATNPKTALHISENKYIGNYSLALCLEDSISDNAVEQGEEQIIKTFQELSLLESQGTNLPKIFIRVRNVEQVYSLYERLWENERLLTGFIFPKYTLSCADKYNKAILDINNISSKDIYMMPTLESGDMFDLRMRNDILYNIKQKLDSMKKYVLNIRVGGNDFCNYFGVRRHSDETIYDIQSVNRILIDIITVFSADYVISAPVWEYFGGENDDWESGMRKEVNLDILNGFIGKTVIHPKQINVFNDCMRVSKKDYIDAVNVLGWNKNSVFGVEKSIGGERMNEVKTHSKWAKKIIALAEYYGIK